MQNSIEVILKFEKLGLYASSMVSQYLLKSKHTQIYALNLVARSMIDNALQNVNRFTACLFLHNFSEL